MVRPYTPVSDDEQLGFVDFVIKLYPTGKMSQVLAKMQVGDSMLMKGPRGRFTYKSNMAQHIGASSSSRAWNHFTACDKGTGLLLAGPAHGCVGLQADTDTTAVSAALLLP